MVVLNLVRPLSLRLVHLDLCLWPFDIPGLVNASVLLAAGIMWLSSSDRSVAKCSMVSESMWCSARADLVLCRFHCFLNEIGRV